MYMPSFHPLVAQHTHDCSAHLVQVANYQPAPIITMYIWQLFCRERSVKYVAMMLMSGQ